MTINDRIEYQDAVEPNYLVFALSRQACSLVILTNRLQSSEKEVKIGAVKVDDELKECEKVDA